MLFSDIGAAPGGAPTAPVWRKAPQKRERPVREAPVDPNSPFAQLAALKRR
jgi:hypothetical protein